MGLVKTNGHRNNLTSRLAELARELAPTRLPWFVHEPVWGSQTPSIGWWWTPTGSDHPVYLGHNHIVAEIQLRQLIDAETLPK